MEMDFDAFREMENRTKIGRYRDLNRLAKKGETVFTGSSLMEFFPINELLMDRGVQKIIYNRGMAGYVASELERDLDACVLELAPSKLFINIGTNDLDLGGDTIGNLMRTYRRILERVQRELPDCKITVMAYYPCVEPVGQPVVPPGKDRCRTLADIHAASQAAAALAHALGCQFIDVNRPLVNDKGYLKDSLASDPIHMWPRAYDLILDEMMPYL